MSKNPHVIQELKPRLGNKLRFSTWIKKYDVNISLLADNIGCTRQHIHKISNGESSASLSIALAIYYISGGLVSQFSLLKDGDALEQDLRPWINDTHTLNRSKISRGNRLTRYHLRKL